jgi:selenide, water dikinase
MQRSGPTAVPITQDLVLVGGGHAHVHVLKRFGMRPMPGVRVTLIACDIETPYSGMLPGYVAGYYRFDECHIDLMRLARFAGARLVHDEVVGLDRERRELLCRDHPPVRYDFVSLDIGITPRRREVTGAAEHTIAVKPIDRFARRWEALIERARELPRLRLAVVGGGAGGVELALAARRRLATILATPPELTLITREALLPSHNSQVRAKFMRLFAEKGIRVAIGDAVIRVEAGRLHLASGAAIEFDETLWVTEAAAAPWLAETGLKLDANGFVEVDQYLRSSSDELVFAAGDVAAMQDHPREKSGVYAVRAGPKLAANLRRALSGKPLKRAVPQRRALALIGTGDAYAVASRGRFTAEGAWLWRLKQWIDRRWMGGYTDLPVMAAEAGEMRCGGCAAKVPADVLGRVMARLSPMSSDAVTIGPGDDAALVSFPGAPPLLQTVDFFRALVDDPYLFGRIAATHALGDIYAMGGMPETALAIATLPPARAEITEHDLFHMIKGGAAVLEEAGAVLVGGHSAEGAEPGLGFAITGRTQPGRLLRKGGLRPGDRLILTKPLGTGAILAAEMRGLARARHVIGAIETMLQPAAAASAIFADNVATACTDVTGFGLLGHLLEMLAASAADARLDPEAIPALDGALEIIASGVTSSLHPSNLSALASLADADPGSPLAALLIDPQTAGGLLAGVSVGSVDICLTQLREAGYRAAVIGVVDTKMGAAPRIRFDAGCLAIPALAAVAQ